MSRKVTFHIGASCILGRVLTYFQLPCGTEFFAILIFAGFFFAIRKNKFPQNKITVIFFSEKKFSTVEIMYKNTGLKKKNAIHNSVDHTSTGTLVIAHPLQCNRVTLINLSYILILFCLYSTN